MKKILSIVIAVMLVVSMSVIASAQSYNPNGECDIKATIKKADPANVIKDGVIGNGEYEKLNVNLDIDETSLNMMFGNNASMYELAEALVGTMEYYFSWDDVHGFNFAVKCRPTEFSQTVPMGEGSHPGDEFLCNLGLQVELAQTINRTMDDGPLFYYAISKNAQTGEYMTGHYEQFGLLGNYNAVGGQDFEVAFGGDGSVLYEWSIPFSAFLAQSPADGAKFGFTLAALAGTDTPDSLYTNCYGVALGGAGFMVDQRNGITQVDATLSGEMIDGGSNPNPNPNPTPDPIVKPDPDNGNGNGNGNGGNNTGDNGGNTTGDNGNGTNTNPTNNNQTNGNGTYAPSTGDASVIAAAASVVSALGFMVSKKRK